MSKLSVTYLGVLSVDVIAAKVISESYKKWSFWYRNTR